MRFPRVDLTWWVALLSAETTLNSAKNLSPESSSLESISQLLKVEYNGSKLG